MTTERIDIIVSEKGSRVVKRNLDEIGMGARGAAAGVDFLKKALLGLGAALAVRELIRMADTYTLIINRLKLVTTGTANLTAVNDALFESAQRSRSSYESTVVLYSKLARAASGLGLGQQDLIGITESLNQTFRISGATAMEAEQSTRQLAQALGTGALRGDELVSVLEGNSRLSQVIADGMGVTVGELKKLGEAGKLTTAAIIDALQKAAPALQAEFAQMQATVGESLGVLSDAFMHWIGQLDASLGITAALANTLLWLAANMDTLAQIAAVVGIALAAAFAMSIVGNIGIMISEVIRLEMALGATGTASAVFSAALKMAQGGVRALTAAIAANPIGLLIVAITTIISYLYIFRDEISVTADGVVSLGDVFRAIFSFIMDLIGPVVDFFVSAWQDGVSNVAAAIGTVLDTFVDVMSSVASFAAAVINAVIAVFVGGYNAVVGAWSLFPAAMRDLGVMAMNGLIDVVAMGIQGVLNAIQTLLTFVGSAAELVGAENPFAGLIAPDTVASALEGFKGQVTGAAGEAGAIISGAFADAFATDYLGNMLGAVMERARSIATERAAAEAAAAGSLTPPGVPGAPGAGTSPGGGKAGKGSSDLNDQLERMEDLLKDIKGPLDEYTADVQALDTLLEAGAITAAEYADKFREIRMEFLETTNSFASGVELGLLKVQEDFGNMTEQVSGFIGNTFNGATDLITNFVMTGKFAFSDFASSVIEDLSKMVTQMLIMKPIADALSSALSGIGTGGGGGFLSSLFGGLGGGGAGGFLSSLFGGLGFATGGSFTVGGAGGVDSQMVAFRASPGEKVDITRPGEQKNGGDPTVGGNTSINMNVYTQDAQSFKRSEGQIQAQLARMTQRGKRNL